MANTYILQTNPIEEIDIVALPVVQADFLTYQGGGGVIFGNTLQSDLIAGGGQYHEGNTVITGTDIPVYKSCNNITVTKETIDVVSPSISRGLFIYRQLVSNPSDI